MNQHRGANGVGLQVSGSIVLYNTDPNLLSRATRSFFSSSLNAHLTLIDNTKEPLDSDQIPPCVDYVHLGKNVGFGAGHNIAIRKYLDRSECHLILNPDTRFGPGVLETLYHFIKQHPEVGLVMPRVLYPDGTEQRLCKLLPAPIDLLARRFGGPLGRLLLRRRLDRYELSGMEPNQPAVVPCLSGCFMLVRTHLFREIGLFDERYFMYLEDVDLCRRIGMEAMTVFFPDVAVYHEYTKGSYKDRRLMKYHLESAWRYFWKWGWLFDENRRFLNSRAMSSIPMNFQASEVVAGKQR